jgi:hypothetical protein
MGFANRAIVAAGLGFAVSALVGCGGSGSLLSNSQANRLDNQLSQAADDLASYRCVRAAGDITAFRNAVDSLNTVNATLIRNLDQGASTIQELASRECPTYTRTQTQTTKPQTTTRTDTTKTNTNTTATATTDTSTDTTTTQTQTQPTTTVITFTTPTDTTTTGTDTTGTTTTGTGTTTTPSGGTGFGTGTTTTSTVSTGVGDGAQGAG